jgi:hypothetical protein
MHIDEQRVIVEPDRFAGHANTREVSRRDVHDDDVARGRTNDPASVALDPPGQMSAIPGNVRPG